MRPLKPVAGLGFALALGLGLSACNLQDEGTRPQGTPGVKVDRDHPLSAEAARAFERERVELKAGEPDPERLDAAMRALTDRYGFAEPEAGVLPILSDAAFLDRASLAAAAAARGTGMGGDPQPVATETPMPIGKIAAAAATRWYRAKAIYFDVTLGWKKTHTVPNLATIRFRTTHDAAVSKADPMVFAFLEPLDAVDWPNAPFKLLGISDDDGGNFDADFSWKNTTGKDQIFTYVAHAYSDASRGEGNLIFSCTNQGGSRCGGYTVPIFFGGVASRTNSETPPSGCKGPTKSNISLSVREGGAYWPVLFAVNMNTMRGGLTENNATALDDVLTASGGNYVVGMALSQGPASAGEYVGFQGNNYTCP